MHRHMILCLGLGLISLAQAAIVVDAYKGKFVFTTWGKVRERQFTACIKVNAKEMKQLRTFKCAPYKTEQAPLSLAFARCEKAGGMRAYLFVKKNECVGAQKDLEDGDAS